nr:putative aspartic protease [Quercus suber]
MDWRGKGEKRTAAVEDLNTDVIPIAKRSSNVAVIVPKSGASLWADLWAIPAASRFETNQIGGRVRGPSPLIHQRIEFCLQAARALPFKQEVIPGASPSPLESAPVKMPAEFTKGKPRLDTNLIAEATYSGITVDFIQRDSTESPLYNASHTHFDRLYKAFARSISRANHFRPSLQSKSSIQSNVIANGGEYLMKISLGTPAVEVLGIADTGSDLTWTQCEPCEKCYKQNLPLFDPQQSSTYGNVPCDSSPCKALDTASCGTDKNTCQYGYSYGDQSFTNGDLGVETLTVGSTTSHQVTLPNIVFGCGHNNDGTFGEARSGIIGLGGGPLSLQWLGFWQWCGFNTLGCKRSSTFYYLTLEGISVGNKRFAYKASSKAVASNEGNIVIDSGTTLTLLPPEFHEDLVSAVEKAIDAERVSDPRGVLSLCFRSKDEIDIPIITAHFTGADVMLKPINTFARMDDDLVCFTMIPSGSVAIFGNLAQINFLVGYDLKAKKVSFLPADCTKH